MQHGLTTTGNGDVYFKKSTDGGNNFGSTKNLSNNSGDSQNNAIIPSGTGIFVVWDDNTTGIKEVLFEKGV